ncbi:MAG: cytochrome d ubiquinol oxidase subunit II [Nitrospira sp.]|nr:cytochrome d ubiquinol oxidase subunit II [Nitrospira sp.]
MMSIETLWFTIVVLMFAVYAVLDGFDVGVGILYVLVANTDEERRLVLKAIGPVWKGNEVWLVAGGGLLFLAFPRVFAAGFSGFYLALNLVLWFLIMRGLSLALRSHLRNPLWRTLLGCDLCGLQSSAGPRLRRCLGQHHSRRTAWSRRVFLCRAVDHLYARINAWDSRLVHGPHGRARRGDSRRAWSELS